MKKLYAVLSVLLLVSLVLAACAPAEEEEVCKYKIGFVTDVGRIDDQSFNESGWNGVIDGAKRLGLAEECYSFIETTDSADYIPNIESFINEGYDIIVTSGFAMGTATREAGRLYPDVYFIGTDQSQVDENFAPDPIDNVVGLIFHEDISGFLAGAMAGLMTKTNMVGGVYGCPSIPPVVRFEMGYYNGAKYVNPDVEIINVYHPGSLDQCFVDSEFGSETAATMIEEGADIIFGAGGITGNGALIGACNDGKYVIGVDTDQYLSLPEVRACILSSATKDLVTGVSDLIIAVDEGTFPGGEVFGPAKLAPYHDLDNIIPGDVKAQLDEITDMLAAGDIDPCVAFEGAQFPDGAFCVPGK